MALLVGSGEGADLKPTPDAITPAGDEAVEGIGEEGGNDVEKSGKGGPWLGQLAKGGKDRPRADEDLGVGGERVLDDKDGTGSAGGVRRYGVWCEERGEGRMVRRGETQAVVAVVAEEPLD